MRYFKAIAKVIIAVLRLRREVVKNKLKERSNKLIDMDDALKLYNDVAKGWLVKTIKKPLISLIQLMETDLDFSNQALPL